MPKEIVVNPGDRFHSLTVIEEVEPKIGKDGKKKRIFKCLCDCGNITFPWLSSLRSGNTKSCGCHQKAMAKTGSTKNRKYQVTTGDTYGWLTVIKETVPGYDSRGMPFRQIECLCKCGKIVIANFGSMRNGSTSSCGCLGDLNRKYGSIKHGCAAKLKYGDKKSQHPIYIVWAAIKDRCFNGKDQAFPSYGGRGITMYEPWINDFQAFYDYVGDRPSEKHSLDRINNDGNYEPGNVRWATRKEQARNRRSSRILTVNGQSKTIAEWVEITGIQSSTIQKRLYDDWCETCAVTIPVGVNNTGTIKTCTHIT